MLATKTMIQRRAAAHNLRQLGRAIWQHRNNGLLGTELHAPEDDHYKADAVADIGHCLAPWRLGQFLPQGALHDDRGHNGYSRSDT